MSGLAGVLAFDGAPAGEAVLAAIDAGLLQRAGGSSRLAAAPGVSMLYRDLRVEEGADEQPLVAATGEMLAWDGRLDNAEELASALFGSRPRSGGDAALVLEAYRRWGTQALPLLVGDFALALWDRPRRTLLLARDAFGIRPLYYRATPSGVIWSSSLSSFLFLPDFVVDVDEQYVAGYLTSTSATDETPFRSVTGVPAGGAVLVRDGALRRSTFWSVDPHAEVRCAGDAEYEERFRALFYEAVRVRLRAGGAVAAELSGGLDSSSIVCVADSLLRDGRAHAPRVHTISHVYPEAKTSDERPFMAEVERQRGAPGHHIAEDRFRILRLLEEDEPFLDFPTPFAVAAAQYGEVRRVMRSLGARVLLSGTGGDQVVWGEVGPPVMLADTLLQGRPLQLHRDLVAWSRALNTSYLQLVRDGVVWPLLPRPLQSRTMHHVRPPRWIDAGFARRTHVAERLLGYRGEDRFRLPSRRDDYNALQNAIWLASRAHAIERGAFELRFPFLHRPLVELALAIPVGQKLRPGETRSILRRALRGVLPEPIAARKTKQSPDEALHRAVAREGRRLEELVATARVCRRGYVRAEELRDALRRMRHGLNVSTPAFVRTLSLELWLRDLERAGDVRRARVHEPNWRCAPAAGDPTREVRQPRVPTAAVVAAE